MIKKVLTIALLLAIPVLLFPQQYNFKIYNQLEDFNLNQVLALYQDKTGFLWVGSAVGLFRYDSENWLRYDLNEGLPSNEISAIAEDDSSYLWVGTSYGLVRLNLNNVIHPLVDSTQYFQGEEIVYVRFLANRLWVSISDKGLFVGKNGHFETVPIPEIKNASVFSMEEDALGNIYATLDNGHIVILDEQGKKKHIIKPPDEKEAFSCVLTGREEEPILASTNGLYRFNPINRQLRPFETGTDQVKNLYIFSLLKDKEGTIWAATDSGIVRIRQKDKEVERINKLNGLPDEMIYSLLIDREQNIWIGTYTAGLVKLAFRNILTYNEDIGLESNVVNSIIETEIGTKLVGTDAGIFKIKELHLQRDPRFRKLDKDVIWVLYKDRQGNIWAGGEYFLSKWDKKKKKLKFYTPTKELFVIFDIMQDRQGKYWFATSSGLFLYRKRKFILQDEFAEHKIKQVLTIEELRDGEILLGTDNGLVRYDGKKFTFIQKEDGLPDRLVYAIHEDKNGRLWLGCDQGLIEVRDNNFRLYGKDDGLHGTIITQILEDDQGTLWLCGDQGLQRFENGKITFLLTRHDGLVGEEFTTQNSSLIDSKGVFWLGGFGGLTVYNPKNTNNSPIAPKIYLKKAAYQRDSSNTFSFIDKKKAIIPFSSNNIIFDFNGIYFRDENELSFLYKLEGVDNGWQRIDRLGEVRYNNLWPGEYHFKVKAMLKHNKVTSEEIEKGFVIEKPFYLTYWFIAALVGLLLFLGLLVIRIRTKRIRRLNKRLEAKIAQRTKELAVTKAFLENIIEHVGSAIIAVDSKNKISTWNKHASRVFGYAKEKMLGNTISVLDDAEDAYTFSELLEEVKKSGEILQLEMQKKNEKGQTLDLVVNATPLYDENDQLFSVSFAMEDFSERNRLIDTVINREKALAGITALNRLLATLSHYFNNSIMAINGMAQLANLDEKYYEKFLRTTETQVTRIQAVLKSLSGLVQQLNLKTRDYVGESNRLFDIEKEIDSFLKTLQK